VRELVRRLHGHDDAYDLLHRLLADLEAWELLPLIPPPPVHNAQQAPVGRVQAPVERRGY
jgi:hypothetical protein